MRNSTNLSAVACRYVATIFFSFVALFSGASISNMALCVIVGVIVDVFRHYYAPELRLSASERHDSLWSAIRNESVAVRYLKRTRFLTTSLYVVWITYAIISLCLNFSHPVANHSSAKSLFVSICAVFYPVTRSLLGPFNYPVLPYQVRSTVQILTCSWWLLMISVVLELSGGTFLRLHYDLRKFTQIKLKRGIMYGSDRARFWVGFSTIIFLYFFPLYFKLIRVLPPDTSVHQRHQFWYILMMNAWAVILDVPLIRIVYSVVLAKASNAVNLVASFTSDELGSPETNLTIKENK